MAHFARLNEDNVVIAVHAINDVDCCDEKGYESEQAGVKFLQNLWGKDTKWVQTSYNSRIRKHYAFVGGSYSLELDAFLPPQPFDSWVLNEETCLWEPPIPYPGGDDAFMDPNHWVWDEENLSWHEVEEGEDIGKYMARVKPVITEVHPTVGDQAMAETGSFGEYTREE